MRRRKREKKKKSLPRRCEGPESKRSHCIRVRGSQHFELQWRRPFFFFFYPAPRAIQRPRAPPFFKPTITSIDFQLKWSRKVSISSAGTIGKRSRERPRSKRHRSSIKIIKKSIDCTTKIYRNGPEVTKNENYVQLLCASKGKWRHTRFVKTAKRKYRK